MNWENIIAIFVSSIAISISTYYLKKGNSNKIQKNLSGNYVLRLPRMYKYIGILSILIITIFVVGAIFIQDSLTIIMAILMSLLFGGLGIPCLLGYQNYSLSFNDENITVSNWRGRKAQLRWTEIQDVKFSTASGYIKLKGENSTLKINHHLDGLNIFKDKIDKNTKWNSKELKIP